MESKINFKFSTCEICCHPFKTVGTDTMCSDCVYNMRATNGERVYYKYLHIKDWENRKIAKEWKKSSIKSAQRILKKVDKYGNYTNKEL